VGRCSVLSEGGGIVQLRKKFLLGVGVLTAIVMLAILLISRSLGMLSKQTEVAARASELSVAALDFSAENFHTQLEVWEYVYAPSPVRLQAFQQHEMAFDSAFEVLLRKGDTTDAVLSDSSRETLRTLRQHVPVLKATWRDIVDKLQSGAPPEEIRAIVLAGEQTFDDFHFDDHVNLFISQQKQYVAEKESEKEHALTDLLKSQLWFAIYLGGAMLATFGLFYWWFSTQVLTPLAQFTRLADAISRGDSVEPPDIQRNDEVGALSDAFGRMVMAVRFLTSEAELASQKLP
jgi:HAMP domain-containing protein